MHPSQDPKDLFEHALGLDEAEREEFLDALSQDSPGKAEEIRGLLAAHDDGPWFLEDGLESALRDYVGAGSLEGRTVGEYEIVRELGSGGMGVVCLARRRDDFDHVVAIKFTHWGIAEAHLARFSAERAMLATLRHPGIAQLYGGGAIDDRPYLVMEYVDGAPITTYGREHALSLDDRLDLLRSVCDAVQYAHQNLIIHRDLKPSNILVTADGTPKLLDFGIAKPLVGPEEGQAPATVAAFTPGYSSPEQLRGERITTAADVFALGVIAYELLTDRHPFPTEGRGASEIERRITEQAPPRPSAVDGPLSRYIGRDLDTVVLKALAGDPELRYESPRAFADDIKRYLRGHPVAARPPSAAYQARRFVGRHRVATAAVLVALALTSWQAVEANQRAAEAARERDRAQAAVDRSNRVNGFLQGVLATANPSWYVEGDMSGPDLTVMEALQQAAARMELELADDPEVRADIHHTLGDTYRALLDHERMVHHFEASLALRERAFEAPHPKIAEALYYASAAHSRSGQLTESEEQLRRAVEMQRARDEGNNLPFMLQDLGHLEDALGNPQTALLLQAEATAEFRRRFGPDHRYFQAVASAEAILAEQHLRVGDLPTARRLAESSTAHAETTYALQAMGAVHAESGQIGRAERLLRRAFEMGAGPRALYALASWALIPAGRLHEARAVLTEVDAGWSADARPSSAQQRLRAMASLAYVLALQGAPGDSEALANEVETRLAELVAPADRRFFWDVEWALRAARGRAELLRGHVASAELLLAGNLEILRERGVRGPQWRTAHADVDALQQAQDRATTTGAAGSGSPRQ
ncbi:MAG: serine/threonine-protein kinase [Gemmatimonadota bacterium]